jgi:hypothetical protein
MLDIRTLEMMLPTITARGVGGIKGNGSEGRERRKEFNDVLDNGALEGMITAS